MGQSKQLWIVGIALLAVAGAGLMERRKTPDQAASAGPAAAAEKRPSPGPGRSDESRRNASAREKKDPYYYPSSGRRTVQDEVNGLLATDGGLTDRAAVYFGLDEEQRSRVDSWMKTKLEEESRRIAKRAVPVSDTPGEPAGRMSWEIHALKDRGRSFWEGLYQDLPALVGAGRAEAFVAAMNDRTYGGFGRLDGRIGILSKEGEGQVQVEWFDPVSGSTAGGEIINFNEFDTRYGAAFRQEHAEAFAPEPGP